MIVLDASATIDWALRRPAAAVIDAILGEPGQHIAVPHLWSVEVVQVVRRFDRAGEITSARAGRIWSLITDVPAIRYPHEPLLERAWQLRANTTMYDAMYLVLAEMLDVALVTSDSKLAGVPGVGADVRVIGS